MIPRSIQDALQKIVGPQHLLTQKEDMLTYSYDAAVLDPVMPSAAVIPENTAQLGEIIALCHENTIPITVRGSGTNLSGGTIPQSSGIVILTGRMNNIIEINEADMYAVVEPGVVTATLAAEVEKLFRGIRANPGPEDARTMATSEIPEEKQRRDAANPRHGYRPSGRKTLT